MREIQFDTIAMDLIKHLKSDQYKLSNPLTFNALINNRLLLSMLVRSGISYKSFAKIVKLHTFSEVKWAEFLNIAPKTLLRYRKKQGQFGIKISERILEITEIIRIGLEVFSDQEKFNLWLETPNFALGQKKPLELMGDAYGQELIKTELVHIEHGIFA